MTKLKQANEHGLHWLLAYETEFFLPVAIKRLSTIRKKAMKLPRAQKYVKKVAEVRSKIVREFVRERRKIFVRSLLFTMIWLNRKGFLKRLLKKARKQSMSEKQAKKLKEMDPKSRKKVARRKYQMMKLVREGLKESFFKVMKSNGMVLSCPLSLVTTKTFKKNFKTKQFARLKDEKKVIFKIPIEIYREFQAIFSDKIQALMMSTLVEKGPYKFLQKYHKTTTSFMDTTHHKEMTHIASNFWDMFKYARKATSKAEERAAFKRFRQKLKNKAKKPMIKLLVTPIEASRLSLPMNKSKPIQKKMF